MEGDAGAEQQLARVGGQACERDLGELASSFARAEDEQDPAAAQRPRVGERAQEAGVVERRRTQPGRLFSVGAGEPVGVWGEACRLAAHDDLDGVGERVQEAGEGGDERELLVGAAQLEARPLRGQEAAVAAVGELDEAACEHAPDGDVERGEPRLPRGAPGSRAGSPSGASSCRFGVSAKRASASASWSPESPSWRSSASNAAAGGDKQRRRGRERCRQQRGEEQEGAVGGDGGAGEERELLAGEAEGEPVLELDVGGHLHRRHLDHPSE